MNAFNDGRCLDCGKRRDFGSARGYCQRCYTARRRRGDLPMPRLTRTRAEVVEDWSVIGPEYGYRTALAAHRLGMTPAALCKALCRAGVRHVHLSRSERGRLKRQQEAAA